MTTDFDSIQRSRDVDLLKRAAQLIDCGNEAMNVLCQREVWTSSDDPAMDCLAEPDEMECVARDLLDLAERMESPR